MLGVLLTGCTPEPMAAYLRALAVFRLVAEQADSDAKGHWTAGGFWLDSKLDEAELVEFFLDRYSPTPVVAPWNSGSGYYEGDRREGMEAILRSESERFRDYREAIGTIQEFPEMPSGELTLGRMLECVEAEAANKKGKQQRELMTLADSTRIGIEGTSGIALLSGEMGGLTIDRIKAWRSSVSKSEAAKIATLLKAASKLRSAAKRIARAGGKEQIVLACRNRLSDRAVDWLDAAVVMTSETRIDYPPILGTAGNEGRLDYTNAFMERLASMLLGGGASSAALLRNSLFGEQAEGLEISSVGQHDPGRAGGYNQGPGIEAKEFPSNHWNFILAIEGAVAWASGVGRRQAVAATRNACSPFTVEPRAAGYGSATDADDVGARAEIWMPLWDRPCVFEEIRCLLREGRAEVGKKPASDAVQFAEAASSLGVDRGITGFVRYSLLKRRGDSYIALPAGRFRVQDRRDVDLLQDLDPILGRLDRFKSMAGQAVPQQFLVYRRAIDNAVFDLLIHEGQPGWMKRVLLSLGRMEQYFAGRDPQREPGLAKPLKGLSPRWLKAADDGSLEFRIAAALASIGATGEVGPLRANLAPIDPKREEKWANGNGQHCWAGNDVYSRLAGVLRRRIMDAERLGCKSNPVRAELDLGAEDAGAFIYGAVDDEALQALLFGMTLIEWADPSLAAIRRDIGEGWRATAHCMRMPRSWILLKYLFLARDVKAADGTRVVIRSEEAIVPLLCADRIKEACEVAKRRLRISGLVLPSIPFEDDGGGTRFAAALLLPVDELELRAYIKTKDE